MQDKKEATDKPALKPQDIKDPEAPSTRVFKGTARVILTVVCSLWVLYHVLYIAGILSRLNVFINTPQHLAAHLGFVVCLVYLLVPATKRARSRKWTWYDIALLAVALGWNIYLIVNFNDLLVRTSRAADLTKVELVVAWIYFFVVFEAARRTVGPVIAIIAALFLVYPLVSAYMPGIFHGPSFSFDRIARGIGLFVTGMYGGILNISATVVITFLLFGQLLFLSGAGQWFIDIANSLLGHVRGGSAKVAVVASALMGTVQGTAVGNIATVGIITIPMMKKTGYPPHIAGAIEATASNGGQIMPPVMGIAAFIMTDFLGVKYNTIALTAIIPAVIYFAAIYFTVDFEAVKAGLHGIPRSQLPRLVPTLANGWYYVLPLGVLLYFLLVVHYEPQLSAIYSSVIVIAVSWFNKKYRITFGRLVAAMRETAQAMMTVATVVALAGVVTAAVELTGLSYRLSFLLIDIAGGNLLYLMIMTAIVSIILGMGMPTSAAYIVLAVLAAPALVKLGMPPMAAHFFVFYFGVAAIITPPVCPGSFVAASIAQAPMMKTAFSACRFSITCYLAPFFFAYHPGQLLMGTPQQIVWDSFLAALATFGLAAALGGHMFRTITRWWRVVLGAASLSIIHPSFNVYIVGVGVVVAITLFQIFIQPRLSKARDSPSPPP